MEKALEGAISFHLLSFLFMSSKFEIQICFVSDCECLKLHLLRVPIKVDVEQLCIYVDSDENDK